MPTIIDPTLFKYVFDAAAQISNGTLSHQIRRDSELVIFLESFLAQFSANYLHRPIHGFNPTSRAAITRERRRLQSKKNTKHAQALIFHLEPLFSLVPELSYGGSGEEAYKFYYEYFPELLDKIVSWLEECSADANEQLAAKRAASIYHDALESG